MMHPEILVPALALRTEDGAIDWDATREYASRAAETWVDKFIINGSTARGDQLGVSTRAELLDLWVGVIGKDRAIACTWVDGDIEAALSRGLPVMSVLKEHSSAESALSALMQLPAGALVYSHPMYSEIVLDSELCAMAQQLNALPAGAKLAKVTAAEIRKIRDVAGPHFSLWDGSCRHIAASVQAGANGVVATPLASLAHPFPEKTLALLQADIDRRQADLDALPDRTARSTALLSDAWQAAGGSPRR